MSTTWLDRSGPLDDIVVSSRVRLARNLQNIPFPGNPSESEAWVAQITNVLTSAGGGHLFASVPLDNPLQLASLVEQHTVSPTFANATHARALVVSPDNSVAVMIGEEDHIRLQVFRAGLDLEACLTESMRIDDLLDSQLPYAFSEELGFLTACPTNLGTAMRASVMLHLPALTLTGSLGNLIAAAGHMGVTVRGLYGEGTQAIGHVYQLSNQGTFGLSENEIITRVADAAHRIIASERATRELLRHQSSLAVSDAIWRGYGLLTHARQLGHHETMQTLGLVRAGVAMGEITHITIPQLNQLLVDIQPATLSLNAGQSFTQEQECIQRATVVRKAFQAMP